MLRIIPLFVLFVAIAEAAGAQAATSRAIDTSLDRSVAAKQPLRPGDMVRMRIWREPDLSGDFAVDEDGVVVFPMIGRKNVLDLSTTALRDTLIARYQVYLRNPSIAVTSLRRVNVFGAVRNPGLYPVDPTMSLSDVLAAAGGATPQGAPDRVQLIRAGITVMGDLARDTRLADLPVQSGDQIVVPERNWVSRNSGVVAAGITASVSLFIALLSRR